MEKPFILPGQPTKYARDKLFEIVHTKLEVELDFEKKSITGRVEHTLNSGSPLAFVELDASELEIRSVKVDGRDAGFEYASRDTLRISPKVAIKGTFKVEIEYKATPRRGLYFRGPTKDHPHRFLHAFTQGQAEDSKYWFPCYDYPNMRTQSEVIVTAPAEMIAISNGVLVSSKEIEVGGAKKRKVWHFRQEFPHPSYLLSVVVGEYDRTAEDHKGVLLEYYAPTSRKAELQRSFSKTPKMIDFFSSVTGQPYPYPKYAQSVVSDFMFGGMENITATTLTERTLHDERAHQDFTSDNLVAHELAHQWFGDYITCRDWSHAWLNEGFANFFTALFKEFDEGPEEYQYFFNTYRETLFDEVEEHYQRPIVTKRYFDPEEMFDSHTYEKGAWVLNALRGYLGDEVFLKGIKGYVAKHRASLVETSDFRRAMEDASGLNLEPFFEQWVFSQGFPEYEARYSWDEGSKTAVLSLEQSNVGSVPQFTTPIEIRLTLRDGSISRRKVTLNSKASTFYFPLDGEPLNVSIDPQNWILKKLNFQKPERMYIFQLEKDQNAMERVRACWELGKSKSDDAITALARAIDSDRFWGVGLEAAANLGKIGTKAAMDALVARKGHPHHKVRRGIAIGLRHFSTLEGNEEAIGTLIWYLNNDYSYYVRAFAAQSLGYFTKLEVAFEALMSALKQESVNDQVRYRAFLGLAERKDGKGLEIAIDYLRNATEYQARVGAALAVGKLGRGRPEALDALLSSENDPDIYVRTMAANAVRYLEDKNAIPGLEKWLAREPSGRCRRRLRETIYLLQQGTRESENVAKLQEDVEKLKSENSELRQRINALEGKA